MAREGCKAGRCVESEDRGWRIEDRERRAFATLHPPFPIVACDYRAGLTLVDVSPTSPDTLQPVPAIATNASTSSIMQIVFMESSPG